MATNRLSARIQPATNGRGYSIFVSGHWVTHAHSWQDACDYCESKGWQVCS